MSADQSNTAREPILAAGGIVLGSEKNAGKICLVRRRRYPGEIALPKGKLRSGETAIEAAQREVNEETGCEVEILAYAGATHYLVKNVPKAVFYFVMRTNGRGDGTPKDKREIETVQWLTPPDALLALTHQEDRGLISAVFGLTEVNDSGTNGTN
jgi:8-oxo-dGTP diphosphatase